MRIALGARRLRLLTMLLRRAILLSTAGVLLGIPLTLWSGRFVSSLLYGLPASDPATLAISALALVGAAAAAGYLPVRRAMRLDPATALKEE